MRYRTARRIGKLIAWLTIGLWVLAMILSLFVPLLLIPVFTVFGFVMYLMLKFIDSGLRRIARRNIAIQQCPQCDGLNAMSRVEGSYPNVCRVCSAAFADDGSPFVAGVVLGKR